MAFVTPYLLVDIVLALLVGIYLYFQWAFGYWKRKGFPYLETRFPYGNLADPLRKKQTVGLTIKGIYDEIKARNLKYCGVCYFSKPVCMVTDTEMIKNVLSRDFEHFSTRGFYCNEKVDPLTAHLFHLSGQQWKNLRAKISPTFTSGKLKAMFETLVACGWPMKEFVERCAEDGRAIDIKEVLSCYTTDVIGSCAFGIDCNSFSPIETPFRKFGRDVFGFSSLLGIARNLITFLFPNLAIRLNIKAIDPKISNFVMGVVRDTIEYRQKNGVIRNDFMQLLMELKQEGSVTYEQVAAQCFVFFLGGFETSSSTMSWALYELSKNEEMQERARREVVEVLERHGGQLTYDSVQEMKYLGQIIDETLRKYPVIPQLHRQCTKDYQLPGTTNTLTKGERVTVSILGLHYDPELFPEPETFNPDRFNDENKRSIKPFSYLPFGDGPRICLGERFSLIQSKVGLAVLLKQFKFNVHEKTQTPVTFGKKSIILGAEGGLWLAATNL